MDRVDVSEQNGAMLNVIRYEMSTDFIDNRATGNELSRYSLFTTHAVWCKVKLSQSYLF